MKFVSFKHANGDVRAGWVEGNNVIDMNYVSEGKLPSTVLEFIKKHDHYLSVVEDLKRHVDIGIFDLEEVELVAPLPNPTSFRDFVAFETHVLNATKRAGHTMAKEWYEIPVFYFSNHHAIKGPNEAIARPKKCVRLDFELEMGCIIGKEGKNISVEEAEDYIFGYTILNDWTARDLQMQEMAVHLGPAKGKDFATSIGPYIVTKDELAPYQVNDRYNLEMTAKINGKIVTEGNFKDIYYSFPQMIERASAEVTLYPGDLLGSGTVGFGCILELGPDVHRWLEPGDEIELEITGLGTLKNTIAKEDIVDNPTIDRLKSSTR
ncbi:fumarylacetoacetate hydrolase family protein [Halalkalibacter alkaliphilus]|uniref:Fumarylacetoacetate hydrolase family protein n=1 Tax=Halalkalibacter alkaliphilus TaxID=2917993 RepID=A0A9X2CUJ0_9BACI|nr:fumarylacetoacetate hydrolase family protein [Halalkalibacter alkaliphilus]MCL7748486.1 fumarylacetoacetate hydrolase family protein [Halalkalibacter alkaliphilus]